MKLRKRTETRAKRGGRFTLCDEDVIENYNEELFKNRIKDQKVRRLYEELGGTEEIVSSDKVVSISPDGLTRITWTLEC